MNPTRLENHIMRLISDNIRDLSNNEARDWVGSLGESLKIMADGIPEEKQNDDSES